MKELTIEEKAKAYDETIDKIKYVMEHGVSPTLNKEDLQDIFPELKESEDEMIRKELLDFCKNRAEYYPNDPKYKNISAWIAWLEKQGENHIVGNNEMVKPIDKVEQKPVVYIPKFHVGDKLVSTYNTSLTYEVLEVGHINGLGNPDYKVEIFTDGKAENPRNIHYMECYKVDEWAKLIEQKPAWSEEDEAGLGDALWAVQQARTLAKDENDMGNLWYAENWLNALKGRLQPKQEWGEEDEKTLNSILSCIKHCQDEDIEARYNGNRYIDPNRYELMSDWLKSLRPKNRWRPSERQMKQLGWIAEQNKDNMIGKELMTLYNDLKQLK